MTDLRNELSDVARKALLGAFIAACPSDDVAWPEFQGEAEVLVDALLSKLASLPIEIVEHAFERFLRTASSQELFNLDDIKTPDVQRLLAATINHIRTAAVETISPAPE